MVRSLIIFDGVLALLLAIGFAAYYTFSPVNKPVTKTFLFREKSNKLIENLYYKGLLLKVIWGISNPEDLFREVNSSGLSTAFTLSINNETWVFGCQSMGFYSFSEDELETYGLNVKINVSVGIKS